jgi:hypothetical protein
MFFVTCMQYLPESLAVELGNLRGSRIDASDSVDTWEVQDSIKPAFLLMTVLLSAIVILLAISIINELLNHVKSANSITQAYAAAKHISIDASGKENWSDDAMSTDTDGCQSEPLTPTHTERLTLMAKIISKLAHPPPGWRAPRSSLITTSVKAKAAKNLSSSLTTLVTTRISSFSLITTLRISTQS